VGAVGCTGYGVEYVHFVWLGFGLGKLGLSGEKQKRSAQYDSGYGEIGDAGDDVGGDK
jgi:hypothetical protein